MKSKDTPYSLDNQFDIGPYAGLEDIEQVKINPLVKGDGVAVAPGLPIAGDTRLNGQAKLVAQGVLAHLARKRRARAHDGHVANKHVPELRELVERGLADELAHAGDAGVVLDLEDGAVLLVDGAELCHLEDAPALAHTLLEKERGAVGVVNPNDQSNDKKKWRERHENAEAKNDVKDALYKGVE